MISLVGTTPAVLTEIVYALANEETPVIPDRVIAITTSKGRDILKEELFERQRWKKLLDVLKIQGHSTQGKLKFGPISDSIRVYSNTEKDRELDDIRTQEDNNAVAEFLMETLRGFTENQDIRLIVSLAGGRKTTGALLHSVMTLIGRTQDSIKHILVNEPWIFFRNFLYPGCEGEFIDRDTNETLNTQDAVLELAEVPFVPLRYLFKRDLENCAGSYIKLMNQLRKRTMNYEDELSININPADGSLLVNDIPVSLSPAVFMFYLYFALRASEGYPVLKAFLDINPDDLINIVETHQVPSDFNHWTYKVNLETLDLSEDPRKWASQARKSFEKAGFDKLQIERLVPKRGNLSIEVPVNNIQIEEI